MTANTSFWQWLKDNDAPNWFAIVFSVFVWPAFVWAVGYWFYKRKVQAIPHLQVLRTPTQTTIGLQPHHAVGFTFTNLTGSVVYLRRVRLLEHQDNFPIPQAAVRDLSGWCQIKFQVQNAIMIGGQPTFPLIDHERILQTGTKCRYLYRYQSSNAQPLLLVPADEASKAVTPPKVLHA
jgi:hypothetical protein